VLKLNSEGDVIWFFEDDTKLGSYSNLSSGEDDTFLLRARTQSNLGDWIMIMDMNGNVSNSRLLSPDHTLISHAAYFDGNVYMNGQLSGMSGVAIDTIYIPQSPLESTAFILALDQSLSAKWISIDTTLTNSGGRIAADIKGVFAYQETLASPFIIHQKIKKFGFNGELIKEVEMPVFAPAAIPFPEIALTDDRIALFNRNSFDSDDFIVLIYNKDLDLLQEKVIVGPSGPYSNQITSANQDFFLSHIHSGELNLNDELTLAYNGSGLHPYIAEIGAMISTELDQIIEVEDQLIVYPNPANDKVFIRSNKDVFRPVKVEFLNLSGKSVFEINPFNQFEAIDVSKLKTGIYVLKSTLLDGNVVRQKVIVN